MTSNLTPKIWIDRKPLHRRGRVYTVRLYKFAKNGAKVERVRDANDVPIAQYTQSLRFARTIRNDLLDQYPDACVAVTYSIKLIGNLCDTIMSLIVNDGTFERRYRVRYHDLTLQNEEPEFATLTYNAMENTGYHLEAAGVAIKYTLDQDVGTSRMIDIGDRTTNVDDYFDDDDEEESDDESL